MVYFKFTFIFSKRRVHVTVCVGQRKFVNLWCYICGCVGMNGKCHPPPDFLCLSAVTVYDWLDCKNAIVDNLVHLSNKPIDLVFPFTVHHGEEHLKGHRNLLPWSIFKQDMFHESYLSKPMMPSLLIGGAIVYLPRQFTSYWFCCNGACRLIHLLTSGSGTHHVIYGSTIFSMLI